MGGIRPPTQASVVPNADGPAAPRAVEILASAFLEPAAIGVQLVVKHSAVCDDEESARQRQRALDAHRPDPLLEVLAVQVEQVIPHQRVEVIAQLAEH